VPGTKQEGRRLDSWKEIAEYLRRDKRTAIRWESERSLPVHRVPGGKRKAVFSYTEELDEWLLSHDEASQETSNPPAALPDSHIRFLKRPFVRLSVLGLVALGVVSVIIPSRHAAVPYVIAKAILTTNSLQVWDDSNRLLWTHIFPARLDPTLLAPYQTLDSYVRIADFTGTGEDEVLIVAPFRAGPNPRDPPHIEVNCFSNRGRILWSFTPSQRYVFGRHELSSWTVRDLFVSMNNAKPGIWLSIAHSVWGNSLVTQLDPENGNPTVRFVNTGIVYKIAELRTNGTTFLMAGGFNNEYAAGSLALIDERRPFASSPQTPGTRHQCVSCPKGAPDYYFVFPRSEINKLENLYENPIRDIRIDPDGFEVDRYEFKDGNPNTVFSFLMKPMPHPHLFRFDSGYDMLHHELEKTKQVNHSIANCPERLHPAPVLLWTATGGWTRLSLEPTKDRN
jgi:hypothetical protein